MTRRTMKQWQALIDEQAMSGLTAQEFCKQNGLSSKTFSARKSKIKSSKQAAPTFSAVKLLKPKPEPAKPILIQCNDIELKLPANLSAARIGEIIKACAS